MEWKELITPKIVVECALFNEHQHVLLVKRKDNELWAMPGGFMELGEQVHDAICREVYEETGLSVNILRLSGVYSHPKDSIYLHLGPQYHVVALVCVGTVVGGRFLENPETSAIQWFPISDLPHLLPGHHHRILDAMHTEHAAVIG
jgi:ADP-ribose pyrophosphatase YjhB (NUDIX family)